MHPINFNVRRSAFYERIAAAVHNSDRLARAVEIELDKRGGYERDVEIEIGDDPTSSDPPGTGRREGSRHDCEPRPQCCGTTGFAAASTLCIATDTLS